jgi:hypothetical protein
MFLEIVIRVGLRIIQRFDFLGLLGLFPGINLTRLGLALLELGAVVFCRPEQGV